MWGALCLGLSGCFEVQTHLSLDQREQEGSGPTTPATPEPFSFLPTVTSNVHLIGSGSVQSESQNFKAISGVSSLTGSVAEGALYRWTKPDLSLARQQQERSP